jgi:hypothetical protein
VFLIRSHDIGKTQFTASGSLPLQLPGCPAPDGRAAVIKLAGSNAATVSMIIFMTRLPFHNPWSDAVRPRF